MSETAAPAPGDKTTVGSNRQTRRKQKTRARLINAANEVFLSRGVDATSVTDITDHADLAYGTFYNYFKSVEEIVPAVVEQVLQEVDTQIRDMPGDHADPTARIVAGMRNLFHRVVSEPAFNWLAHKPDLVAEKMFEVIAVESERDIAEGIETGDFSMPCELDSIQLFCIWGFTGAMRQLSESPEDLERITENMSKLFLRILGVADSKAQKVVEKSIGELKD